MHIFLLKSYAGIMLLGCVLVALFTMLELLGRPEKRFQPDILKKIHRINGRIFFLVSIALSGLCLAFIVTTRTEPSIRSLFHSLFSFTVLLLLCFKVLVVRWYRQFYGLLQPAGFMLSLVFFLAFATSAGYFLLITAFGSSIPGQPAAGQQPPAVRSPGSMLVRTDNDSIRQGKELYDSKCYFCHDAQSTTAGVGPGHKGIMKAAVLPVSRKPATPENIAAQIRTPFRDMPSFSYLTDDEIGALLAYLNTL